MLGLFKHRGEENILLTSEVRDELVGKHFFTVYLFDDVDYSTIFINDLRH